MRPQQGFSMIELLVMITVIGLLSSVVLASMNSSRKKGQYAAAKKLDGTLYRNLGDSLSSEWTFDECSGTVVNDTSSNNKHGTITGGVTWSTSSAFGSGCAFAFDGTSGKITGPSFTLEANMSVSAWILKTTATSQKSFFSNRGSGTGRAYVGLSSTSIFFFDSTGTPAGITSPAGTVRMGQWQFIVLSSDGATTRMYVNGVLVHTATQARSASTGTYGIGWDPNIGTEYWDGSIDTVRVYERALELAEIQKIYAQEAPAHPLAFNTRL